ncbi:hypothetical protein [Saccharothrix yanglingensis]|uniref:Secreted protein n=1 Tax=Saccharothrix yanglingensis TaxID=659496 RepID=A0ABU0WWZ8_9PSEU|nr:hypothetical protein [Saccharothrix yanglingensis]MDQ2583907.1 hypothetical protein [Saccharothrix yanglingensis]
MTSKVLLRLAGVLGAALLSATVAAVPAQAALDAGQPVDIQLRGYSSTGAETQVGRMTGTVRFDNGNSLFRLDVTVERQSSYVDSKVRIDVNGSSHEHVYQSGVIARDFPYGGTVHNVQLTLEGLYYDGATNRTKTVTRSAFYDNPFN